jgi:hypothetical protein
MSEGQQDRLDYVYELLREFDNYGSDDVAVCAREVTTHVRELRQRIDALQARGSELENERRMWKARAAAKQKLLDALLLLWSNRWGYDGDDAAAQELIRQVAKRSDELERDAWCGAANELRAFVQDALLPMGDYAPDLVLPVEGSNPKSKFIARWTERFKRVLERA